MDGFLQRLCEIPPFPKLLCGKEEQPAPLPVPTVNLALKDKELQKTKVFFRKKKSQNVFQQSWPGLLSTKAGAGRKCQVYSQPWDSQAEVKLSPVESSPEKQVWDEGSPFRMNFGGFC